MKRRLPLIVVGLWLVIWLVWPLVSPPAVYYEPSPILSVGHVVTHLDLEAHFNQAAEVMAKSKAPGRRWWDRVWRVLNFLFLVWLLVKLLREPVRKFFSDQGRSRQEELEKLEAAKAAAQADYQAVQEKFLRLSQEIEVLEAGFAARAERLRAEVLEQAKYETALILRKARETAEARSRRARLRLRREIVELAASQAERVLRQVITAEDHRRLLNEYLSGLTAQRGG
ncbi:MAG: hypothetical protein KJ621_05285 [Proteobacteria bacterium]|nr:hypothetical protein [Pseudomonadota bacterium]MBU1741653.1 hypothetical protein [Pseudomonadota bacterium]